MPTTDQKSKIYEMHEHLKRVNQLIGELTQSGLELRIRVFDFETMIRGTQKSIVVEVYEKVGP
jgi:hypothetical protein